MKILLEEYGTLLISCFGGACALIVIINAFFSESGAFAALLVRCMAFWF